MPTHSKSDFAAQEFLTGKTDRRKRAQRVLRDTTTWLGIFLELNANGSDVLSGTGVKYTCLGMFRNSEVF